MQFTTQSLQICWKFFLVWSSGGPWILLCHCVWLWTCAIVHVRVCVWRGVDVRHSSTDVSRSDSVGHRGRRGASCRRFNSTSFCLLRCTAAAAAVCCQQRVSDFSAPYVTVEFGRPGNVRTSNGSGKCLICLLKDGHPPQCCCPVRAEGVMCHWLDFWFQRCIYRLLVYVAYFPTCPFFHFFLTYLLLYSSFSLRLDVVKRQLNLAFLCLFCAVVHFFWLVYVCFCCVRFYPYQAKRLACGNDT